MAAMEMAKLMGGTVLKLPTIDVDGKKKAAHELTAEERKSENKKRRVAAPVHPVEVMAEWVALGVRLRGFAPGIRPPFVPRALPLRRVPPRPPPGG